MNIEKEAPKRGKNSISGGVSEEKAFKTKGKVAGRYRIHVHIQAGV